MCYNNGAKMADEVSVNYANSAGSANHAESADTATKADTATRATFDKDGRDISTYVRLVDVIDSALVVRYGDGSKTRRFLVFPKAYNDIGSTILAASTVLFAGGNSGAYGEVVAGSNLNRPYNLDTDGGGFVGDPPSCPGTWVRVSSYSYYNDGKYIGLFRRIA
jgi:hypothetical protein